MLKNDRQSMVQSTLWEGLFDYAGLFPPARVTMTDAIRSYLDYRVEQHDWMLKSFVLPVSRLEEFAAIVLPMAGSLSERIPLSVLSADWNSDKEPVQEFQENRSGIAQIRSIETRQLEQVANIRRTVRRVYVEMPVTGASQEQLAVLKKLGCYAKIRMGGLSAEAFPSCDEVAAFLVACCQNELVFKATAGLHHPIRTTRPTCDEPDAPTAEMHGFVNVLAAVACAVSGGDHASVSSVLQQRESSVFASSIQSQSYDIARKLFHSIGSCSFTEPIEDLEHLGWL